MSMRWLEEEDKVLLDWAKRTKGRFDKASCPMIEGRSIDSIQARLLRLLDKRRGDDHGRHAPAKSEPRRDDPRPEIPVEVDLGEWEPPSPRRDPEAFRGESRLKTELQELRAARDHLARELEDRDEQLRVLDELRSHRPIPPIRMPDLAGRDPKRRVGTPVMLLSDWHVEEPVKPETVNGLNLYDLSVAASCIEEIPVAFEWLCHDSRYDFREAVIWLGGDLFSGYIHEELVEGNFLSPPQAVVWLEDQLVAMLMTILALTPFERIIVVCNDGNHGRMTHKMRISTRTANSLEWLLYRHLAGRLAGEPRLQFQIADGEYNYLDVYDRTIAFFHGDSVKYQGGVGGLFIPMRRRLNEIRKYRRTDFFCFGHFHQRLDLPETVGNGSMIGVNAYAISHGFSPEPRQQSFFIVDSKYGKHIGNPLRFSSALLGSGDFR